MKQHPFFNKFKYLLGTKIIVWGDNRKLKQRVKMNRQTNNSKRHTEKLCCIKISFAYIVICLCINLYLLWNWQGLQDGSMKKKQFHTFVVVIPYSQHKKK